MLNSPPTSHWTVFKTMKHLRPLSTLGFVISCHVILLLLATPVSGFQRSKSNSRQIAPVRVGDAVEVKWFDEWKPGTVLSYENGAAEVEFAWTGSHTLERKFPLNEIRFPDGEGEWALWPVPDSDEKVAARYITRNETVVAIRTEDGNELELVIEDLPLRLKQKVKRTTIPGQENWIGGAEPFRVGDEVSVRSSRQWYDATVLKTMPGSIEAEYFSDAKIKTGTFAFDDVRYHNGEDFWRKWSDISGQFEIVARFVSRTETDATLLKEDGSSITVPIDKLNRKLRRLVMSAPVKGRENLIAGVNPLRIGDEVEAFSSSWRRGIVRELIPGSAMIEFENERGTGTQQIGVRLENIRFPNNQGHWMKWENSERTFSTIARFIRRTKTHAILLNEANREIKVDIAILTTKLRKMVEKSVVWAPKPPKIEFGEASIDRGFAVKVPDFSQFTLSSDAEPVQSRTGSVEEGGYGFNLENSNALSLVRGTGVGDWVAVGAYAKSGFKGYPFSTLHWVDLKENKLVASSGFSADQKIVDYSATQQRLLTFVQTRGSRPTTIGFCTYRIAPGEEVARPEFQWQLGEETRTQSERLTKELNDIEKLAVSDSVKKMLIDSAYESEERDLEWELQASGSEDYSSHLIGENRLLLAGKGILELYDFQRKERLYRMTGVASGSFQLHPSHKFIAVRRDNGFSICETDSGRQVAFQKNANPRFLGFSVDGTRVVAADRDQVYVWDLTRGGDPQTYPGKNLAGYERGRAISGSLSMIDDRWIWADGRLYSTKDGFVVWSYTAAGSLEGRTINVEHMDLEGNRLLVGATSRIGSLNGLPSVLIGTSIIPHQKVIEEVDQFDMAQMDMLKPGSGVRIVASGDGRIRSGIEAAVAANGWVQDDSSDVSIIGTAGPGKTVSQTYVKRAERSIHGRLGNSETVTKSMTPWIQQVTMQYKGGAFWSKGGGGGFLPGSGTSMEEINQSIARAQRPSYELFEDLELLEHRVFPHFDSGIGRSVITPAGLKDIINGPPEPMPDTFQGR